MKIKIFILTTDSDAGYNIDLFPSETKRRQALLAIMREEHQNPRYADFKAEYPKLPKITSQDFPKVWRAFCEYASDRETYYVTDTQSVILPDPTVVIHLQGGLVQSCVTSVPMNCVTLDTDTDGSFEEDVFNLPKVWAQQTNCSKSNKPSTPWSQCSPKLIKQLNLE